MDELQLHLQLQWIVYYWLLRIWSITVRKPGLRIFSLHLLMGIGSIWGKRQRVSTIPLEIWPLIIVGSDHVVFPDTLYLTTPGLSPSRHTCWEQVISRSWCTWWSEKGPLISRLLVHNSVKVEPVRYNLSSGYGIEGGMGWECHMKVIRRTMKLLYNSMRFMKI